MVRHARRVIVDMIAEEIETGSNRVSVSVQVKDGQGVPVANFAASATLSTHLDPVSRVT